jgi:RNA polymerase sigma-70 factor (ECF subfamily)
MSEDACVNHARVVETEEELVAKAQKGDQDAFGNLVRLHYQAVVEVVCRMCADAQLAEDATQEAFIRAWMNLPAYRPTAPLRSWLLRIAINASLDMQRRQKKVVDEAMMDELPEHSASPEAELVRKETAAQVSRAIASLPEAARSVLVLREYGGLSYQEIAGVLDIPVGTVMSRLNYARSHLRERLEGMVLIMESEYA